jgi:hypothetical protein
MLRTLILATSLLSGCSHTRDITDLHPFSGSLLVSCTIEWQTYLYKGSWHTSYSIFTETIKGYGAGGQIVETAPNLILPPGTTIIGTKLKFESTMASGPGIWIYGNARAPAGTTIPVTTLVESVGPDLVDWQKQHRFRLLPSVSEYLRDVKVSKPPWCMSPNKSLEQTGER